ncbi:MAG: hypothetical protein KBT82_04550 [Marinobacter sp.]|uniref:Wadjet anti-phage system protein JetD domain-containing protein n=1 Tax=Marinobacter sp. TaxID=50741 RepID=UPI001B48F1C3|nr:Wadjet anti-phage system protein JetD domain-containing protein [Marinobacter sp.]MBQ0745081.1 hypothetical protein [Marinobacter sp.]MBQ0813436.1 hypothetical protein [Marinobacter sp.]
MKSPAELGTKLARQWQNADLREQRLFSADSWPLRISIGKPTGRGIAEDLNKVRQHLQRWRSVTVGKVVWQPQRFRSASEEVEVPASWVLHSPSEWVAAANNAEVRSEYQSLNRLVSAIDKRFHRMVIRKRRLVFDRPETQVIQSARLATCLAPGCAEGRPLRALSMAGIDSKFFERNRQLIIQMLDILFDGQASEQGLEAFLGAEDEGNHWLLVADLDGSLLPFSQLRVRAQELRYKALPGTAVLIVENERCLHQLPDLENTTAILGAGLNLTWMQAAWLKEKRVAYWGDIDTWGLAMLARARQYLADVQPLLMNQKTFEAFSDGRAIPEPQRSEQIPETGLTSAEMQLFNHILNLPRGRLEQEFLPQTAVYGAVLDWSHSD